MPGVWADSIPGLAAKTRRWRDGERCPVEGNRMNKSVSIMRAMLLAITFGGISMNAFGFLGFGGTSWKEEVLLHDGSKLIAKRSQSYGGRHEIGQSPPVKEQEIGFALPGSGRRVTWRNEYGEDIGRANFLLIALHILNDMPYIVATPNLCLSYNKWGRPNPPYVVYKYADKDWERISLNELPHEFKEINLVVDPKAEEKTISTRSLVTAELVKKLNSHLDQPEYRSILREPLLREICPQPSRGPKAPIPVRSK
jgi:hypothetical protein